MAGKVGRPPKRRKYNPRPKKVCTNCNREQPVTNFYVASNPATSSDGKYVNVCKECIKAASLNIDGTLNREAFKKMLMLIDRPYLPDVIDISIKSTQSNDKKYNYEDVIGLYMKNISTMPCYSKMSFLESLSVTPKGEAITMEEKPTVLNSDVTLSTKNSVVANNETVDANNQAEIKQREEVIRTPLEAFEITEELIDRFGEGYTKGQYRKMQKKYDKLKQNYQLTTNLHEEALATYVRFKVKEEEATARGDVTSADKWNRAAQDAAEKAKLTPKQLTQADLQGGITTISEISKAVEEATDIIEILPRFKYAPNDAPDFIIYCYINFCRRLKGLPEVTYEEVYKFYDRKKEEYISQYGDPYGIFDADTSKKNREVVQKFIKLPDDYGYGSDNDGE